MKLEDTDITRRRFLLDSSKFIMGINICIISLSGCASTKTYHGIMKNGNISVDTRMFPELSEQAGGILIYAEGFPDPILLINVDGSEFKAISAVCTHQGCTLRLSKNFLRCPCHGSTFGIQGNLVRGPAESSLKIFETNIVDGVVQITVNK
ncbi:MAG TPA: Rieske (2Fe-2S) protein [bacterium]|nr:Rieske (2Fe-2S) protein [bacterium]